MTEPSASARCKSHEAGALNEKNWVWVLLLLDANRPQRGFQRSIITEFSNHTTSIAATTASNGTASRQAAPHSKNAAQRNNRSESPYQGRTAQKDNPTQLIIKQAVDFLIRQVEAGKSETLAAYLTAMARFHNYSFGNIVAIAGQRPTATRVAGFGTWKEMGRFVKRGEKGMVMDTLRVAVLASPSEEGATHPGSSCPRDL